MQASLLALLAVIVPSPTAVMTDNPTFVHEISLPWNTSYYGQPGTITRLVAGDVTGDLRPDVFARGGTSGKDILFMYAPIQGVAMQKLTPQANDFDIAVGDGLNGVDVLVIVGADGLRRMFYTGTTLVADAPVGGNWLNAQLLRCGNVNATGGVDYVGVKDVAARDKLIYRRENGTESVITVAHAILDVQLLHWTNNPTLQAAILSSWGVEVYNLETGLISSGFENANATSDAIAVVHVGTTGPDRLMFSSHGPTGGSVLEQLRRSGAVPEGTPITLTRNDVVAMTSCPANSSAGENLIVSFAQHPASLQLTNQSASTAAPSFSLTYSQDVGFTGTQAWEQSLPANHSIPIYRDLDNDGLGDLLLAFSDSAGSSFEIFTDNYGDEPVSGAVPGGEFFSGPGKKAVADFPNAKYALAFSFPSLVSGWQHLEITVWRQNCGHSALVKDAVGRYLCLLPGSNPSMWASEIPLGTPLDCPCLGDVRWLEIRQVHWNDQLGKIDKVGPTYTAFISPSDDWEDLHPDLADYPPVELMGPPPGNGDPCLNGIGPWSIIRQQARRRRTDPPPEAVANPGPLTDCTPTNSCVRVDPIM